MGKNIFFQKVLAKWRVLRPSAQKKFAPGASNPQQRDSTGEAVSRQGSVLRCSKQWVVPSYLAMGQNLLGTLWEDYHL